MSKRSYLETHMLFDKRAFRRNQINMVQHSSVELFICDFKICLKDVCKFYLNMCHIDS